MVLNPYFQQGSRSEQSLIQDLINEQLRTYGVEVHYLPRKYMDEKTVIREVVQSKFDDAYPLEAYVDTYDGYGENPTILSKFGIEQKNEITLTISKERWETYIEPLMQNEENIKLATRPKEGDLIYFPLGDRLFEIKYVEHEKPFYQLKKTYVYELRCELFRYGDEVIDTGIEEIDDTLIGDDYDGTTGEDGGISTLLGPTQTLTLVGAGITATAVTGIVTGGIRYVDITNRGAGYLGGPKIGISSAPSGGITGIGTIRFITGMVVCTDSVNPGTKSIQHIDLQNAGAGYALTESPSIEISGNGGTGAAATSVVGNDVIGIVTLTSSDGYVGGVGYTTNPVITFSNEVFKAGLALTVGAAATAVVSSAGTITAINITNAGLGYSTAPTITISDPSLDNTGDYKFNEVVTGQTSGTTARVRTWNKLTNVIELASVDGTWTRGEKLLGATSGATHTIRQIDLDPTDDGFADNLKIEEAADDILDFSEQNPFGIP
tara:strand:+ start:25253 stop:26728 length:1476 start_codon:yes stop_codon:yes gene_type:complete